MSALRRILIRNTVGKTLLAVPSLIFAPWRRCGLNPHPARQGHSVLAAEHSHVYAFRGFIRSGVGLRFWTFPFFSHFPFCLAQIRESIPGPSPHSLTLHVPSPTLPYRLRFRRLSIQAVCRVCSPGPVCTSGIRVFALSCRDRVRPDSTRECCGSGRHRGAIAFLLAARTFTFFQPFF